MENSTAEIFMKAAKKFIFEEYEESLVLLTEILQQDETNFSWFLYRATAYSKLHKCAESLCDLEKAEKLQPESFEVSYRKGVSLFNSEKYVEANDSFKRAWTLASNQEQRSKLVTWTNKTELELEERNLLNSEMSTNIKFVSNWYQTPSHVVVTLDSNVSLNSFQTKIGKKNLQIFSRSNVIWEMSLSNSVNQEASSATMKDHKVEFKLKKEVDFFNWVTVDRSRVNEVTSNSQAIYPTSSKVKTDWVSLEKEINQEIANDAKNDPNEGMMRLFKEIYGNANEETRRAMIKSFQTSGGTVLSTNWDEVKEKDYEGRDRPEAPTGQEWKKDN